MSFRVLGVNTRVVPFVKRCAPKLPWRCVSTITNGSSSGDSLLSSKGDRTAEEKHRIATVRLYRILQRTCRSFPVKNMEDRILIQPILDHNGNGRYKIFTPPSPVMPGELYRLFYAWNDDAEENASFAPSSVDDWYYEVMGNLKEGAELPPITSLTCWTTKAELEDAIRTAFRIPYNLDVPSLHRWAIKAVQTLQEQKFMWDCSSTITTEGVRVTATSRCVGMMPHTSSVDATLRSKYLFAYRIRVENVSERPVQLLGRYWHIHETTDDGEPDEKYQPMVVDQPATGAVGQLPVLRPGQVFEYMSSTNLLTRKGVMKGHFYMTRVPDDVSSAHSGDNFQALKDEKKFEVAVSPFPLLAAF